MTAVAGLLVVVGGIWQNANDFVSVNTCFVFLSVSLLADRALVWFVPRRYIAESPGRVPLRPAHSYRSRIPVFVVRILLNLIIIFLVVWTTVKADLRGIMYMSTMPRESDLAGTLYTYIMPLVIFYYVVKTFQLMAWLWAMRGDNLLSDHTGLGEGIRGIVGTEFFRKIDKWFFSYMILFSAYIYALAAELPNPGHPIPTHWKVGVLLAILAHATIWLIDLANRPQLIDLLLRLRCLVITGNLSPKETIAQVQDTVYGRAELDSFWADRDGVQADVDSEASPNNSVEPPSQKLGGSR